MWLPSASDSDGNNVSLWVEVGIREFERKEGTASSTNQLRTLQLFVRSQYIYILYGIVIVVPGWVLSTIGSVLI